MKKTKKTKKELQEALDKVVDKILAYRPKKRNKKTGGNRTTKSEDKMSFLCVNCWNDFFWNNWLWFAWC